MALAIDTNLLAAVRLRLTLSTAMTLGANLGLPKAGTWQKFESLLHDEAAIDSQRAADLNKGLANLLQTTISAGDRAVTLFKVSPAWAGNSISALTAGGTESSAFSLSYPNPLPEAALRPLSDDLHLSELLSGSNSLTLIFNGRRLIEDRQECSASAVDGAALKKIGWSDFDEFILVKRRHVQTYEVVHIDSTGGLVELRVEEHQGVRSSESLLQLQSKVNSLLVGAGHSPLGSPVNLFPAIKSIYDDSKQGIVVELGFTTATGSAKHEKMRAHRKDLRTELFHVGGKKAVSGIISPFRVAVRWQAPSGYSEELMLPGSMRQLAKGAGATLDHALFLGTLDEHAVRRCIKRLVSHL